MAVRSTTAGVRSSLAVKAWHALSESQTAEALGVPEAGLDVDEAASRLAVFGPNRIVTREGTPPLWIFVRQFRSPLIYVLLAAASVSLAMRETTDAGVIMGIVLLNATIGFALEYQAQEALAALRKLTAPRATVMRGGEPVELPAEEVVPGDLLLLSAGDRVAADARVVRVTELEADESLLTGESVPVPKSTELIADEAVALGDRDNMVYMNTRVTRGHARAIVVATGMATEMGRIAGELQEEGTVLPLQRRLKRLGKTIGLVVLGVIAILLAIGVARGMPFFELFPFALGMTVSAIPEGLPIVVTILLAVGVWRMARRSALIRHLPAIEAVGSLTVICSDKTGTLTRNQMTVRRVVLPGRTYCVSGEGYRPEGAIRPEEGTSAAPERDEGLRLLLAASQLCNDALLVEEDGEWAVRGDPTEGALLALVAKSGQDFGWQRIAEITFTAEQRWMATLHLTPEGREMGFAKGAVERLLPMAQAWLGTDGVPVPLSREARIALDGAAHALASEGYRVLALGALLTVREARPFSPLHLEGELVFLGMVGILDPPRPEAVEAIRVCRQAGIQVKMVTGDHIATANSIAAQMGLLAPGSTDQAMDGTELQQLSDDELQERIRQTIVFARVDPEHKQRIVRALQANGEIVGMTGDGVNDAPALIQADLGISMGLSGTEVAKGASDIVLADDNFATIVAAVEEGRWVMQNLKKVLRYLFATGVGELATLSLAVLLGLPLPLVAVQILWLNLVTDGCFDKGLAMEPAETALMRRPPLRPHAPLMSRDVLWPVLMVTPFMVLGTLGVFQATLDSGASLAKAQTMAFSTLVFFQWFSAFSFRSLEHPLVSLAVNRWMVLGVLLAASLHLSVLYLPAMQALFHTVPLAGSELLLTLAIASTLLAFMEGRKLLAAKVRLWR